jgi:acetoin utilization protein AcuB
MIPPSTLAVEAQKLMSENKVRHLPVVGDGKKLEGLVTRERLALKPDILGSLNVWEITRWLANLKVKDLMLKAKEIYNTMAKHKIGCLPVIEEDSIVAGIITETDLLFAFQEMLGLPVPGVRVTIRMPDKSGEFQKLATVLGENKLGVFGIGTFPSPGKDGYYDSVLKIATDDMEGVKQILSHIPEQELVDIREGV